MIKDGGLNFETQLKIELIPSNNGSKNAWKNPWVIDSLVFAKTSIFSPKVKMIRGGLAAILLVSNCYLAAPWLALSHHQGSNLFNSMLIILFTIYFNLKFTGGLITRLCLKAQPRTWWGLNWEPADLEFNSLKITSTMSHSIPYPIQI